MHIEHVGYNLIGGSGTVVSACMKASSEYGHTVHCLSFTDSGAAAASLPQSWTNVPIGDSILGRAYGFVSRSDLRGFEPWIRRADVVFIHLLYRGHCSWAARVARENGIPVVVVPHGALDPWVFSYRGLRKRTWLQMHREVLFGAKSTVLFATEAEANKARQWFIHQPRKSSHGRSNGSLQLRSIWCAQRYDLTPEVLFVGRLHPMKRVLETIFRALRLG